MNALRRSFKAAFAVGIALAIACLAMPSVCVAGEAQGTPPDFSQVGGKVHNVKAMVKPILKIGQLQFKDLNGNGTLDIYEDWRKPIPERVADLLSRMTMVEKAGLMQITSYGSLANATDYINNRKIRYLILRDNLSPDANANRNNQMQAIAEGTRLGIPVVFTANPRDHISDSLVYAQIDATGQWPGTLGLAASFDLKLIHDFAEIARQQWITQGIRKMYGYQVDVASEPRWNRNQTTFGEGPDLSAAITRELVLGFQGQNLGPESVAMTTKHFPGDGAVWNGLDPHNAIGQYAAYPTAGSLFQYQLAPFQAAVDAGTSAVMSYYCSQINERDAIQLPYDWWQSNTQQFEEVGAAYNKTILTTLLRDYMGFKGYVNTDSGVLSNTGWGVSNLTLPQKFAKAVKAGVSIFSDNNNPQGLIDAVNQQLLDETDLNPSVEHLLTEMFKLGLFENPYTDPDLALTVANDSASIARMNQANRQAIVLLRNDEKLLPLANGKRVYAEVFTRSATTSATQTTALKALLAEDSMITVVDTVDQADVVLVWLRPSVYQPGLPYPSMNDIALDDNTVGTGTVAKVQSYETQKPTILVINAVNPWIINNVEPNAAAVIATFDVKAEALLDVVRGRFNPSGKLPMTMPADQDAVNNNAPDVPGYLEPFDYAYKNQVNDKYLFGFGLSYPKQ